MVSRLLRVGKPKSHIGAVLYPGSGNTTHGVTVLTISWHPLGQSSGDSLLFHFTKQVMRTQAFGKAARC